MTTEGELGDPPVDRPLPPGFRIAWDDRTISRSGGTILLGGSPWRVSRLADRTRAFVAALRQRGPSGLAVGSHQDASVARVLLDRGFAHPVPPELGNEADLLTVVTVVPVLDRLEGLRALLGSHRGGSTLVVDDGSADPDSVAAVAAAFGATVVRHGRNRGPAAARNTGLRTTTSDVVAFVDSDCVVDDTWPAGLVWHFADPGVGAVAPRVAPVGGAGGVVARFEQARSALDMGRRAELVRPGSRLGFVPSAAILVRRAALGEGGFDERLRLGEDVDLVWRLVDSGWQVRYDPDVVVRHQGRESWVPWLRRTFEYGTSAAELEVRHPGRLAPARLSGWNVAALALTGRGHPAAASLVLGVASLQLARQLEGLPQPGRLAAETVVRGVLADAAQAGRLLRREWWPVGAVTLLAAPRSRAARLGAACMLVPIAMDYWRERPALDPLRYLSLQLLDDAAYGSGVIASALRHRSVRPLAPVVRVPVPAWLRRRTGRSGP
jgi:mycofactocin system glycosyltransferase